MATSNPIYGNLAAILSGARQYADQLHQHDLDKKTALQGAAATTFQNLLGQGMNQDAALRLAGTLHGVDYNTLAGTLPGAPTDRFGYQAAVADINAKSREAVAKTNANARRAAGQDRDFVTYANANTAQGISPRMSAFAWKGSHPDWAGDPATFADVASPMTISQIGLNTARAREVTAQGNLATARATAVPEATKNQSQSNLIHLMLGLGSQGYGMNQAQTAANAVTSGQTIPAQRGSQEVTPALGQRASAANAADATKRYGIDKNYTIHDLEIDLHNRALAETRAHHERQDKAMLYATDLRARTAMDRNETTKELAKIRAGASFYGPKLSQLSAHDRTQLNDLTYQRALAYKARETAQKDLDYATGNNGAEGITAAQAALQDAQGKVDAISAHIEDFFAAVTPDESNNPYSGPGAPGLQAIPPAGVNVPTVNVPGAGTMQIGHRPATFGALPPADPAFNAWKKRYGHTGPDGTTTYTGTARRPHPMPRTKQTKLFR